MLFASCKNGQQVSTATQSSTTGVRNERETGKDSLLLLRTKQVLTIIKDKRYKDLVAYIHPESGVRFSAYAFVDTAGDLRFTKTSWLKALEKPGTLFNWGSYDGSGDVIMLSISDYFGKFVYDVDFLNVERVSVNEMIGGGNSLNNLEAVYKNSDFTESYFPGSDQKLEGMDWRTLRLVFKQLKGKYYLTGIVHDQWTI